MAFAATAAAGGMTQIAAQRSERRLLFAALGSMKHGVRRWAKRYRRAGRTADFGLKDSDRDLDFVDAWFAGGGIGHRSREYLFETGLDNRMRIGCSACCDVALLSAYLRDGWVLGFCPGD